MLVLFFFIIVLIYQLQFTSQVSFNINFEYISYYQSISSPIPINNIRNLKINSNLLYKQYYITIPICLGMPSSCYKLLYDTTSYHMWITDHKNESNPFITKTYQNSSKSIINNKTIISTSSDYFNIKGKEVNDVCSLMNNRDHYSFFFSFICSMNIDVKGTWMMNHYQFDGVLGLAQKYLNTQDNNANRFSLIDVLYNSKIITRKIFSHKFTDNYRKGKLYLGESGLDYTETNFDDYSQCNCIDRLYWNCKLDYIALGNRTIFNHLQYNNNNYSVIFDSILYGIELPSQLAGKIISDYITISQSKCEAINHFSIKCRRDFNFKQLPPIRFIMQNVTIEISPESLFDLDTYNDGDDDYIYMTNMNITHTTNSRLGLMVLKQYQMIFDSDNNTVGFYKEETYGWSRLTMILISVGGMCVMLILSVLSYNDSLFILKSKIKRSHSMNVRKMSSELRERALNNVIGKE